MMVCVSNWFLLMSIFLRQSRFISCKKNKRGNTYEGGDLWVWKLQTWPIKNGRAWWYQAWATWAKGRGLSCLSLLTGLFLTDRFWERINGNCTSVGGVLCSCFCCHNEFRCWILLSNSINIATSLLKMRKTTDMICFHDRSLFAVHKLVALTKQEEYGDRQCILEWMPWDVATIILFDSIWNPDVDGMVNLMDTQVFALNSEILGKCDTFNAFKPQHHNSQGGAELLTPYPATLE